MSYSNTNNQANFSNIAAQSGQNQQFQGPNQQFQGQNVGRLHVTVIEGRDLLRKEVRSLSEPYVILSIHKKDSLSLFGQEQRTTAYQNNQNPIWNQNFTLMAQEPQRDILRVRVFDQEKLKDHLIGETDIPLFSLFQNQQYGNQQFAGQNQQFAGQNQQFGGQQNLSGPQFVGQQNLAGQQLGGQQNLAGQQLAGQQNLAGQNNSLIGNQQYLGQPGHWDQNQSLNGGLNQNQQFQGQLGQNQFGSQSGLGLNNQVQNQQGIRDEWFQLAPLGAIHLSINYQDLFPFFQQGLRLNQGINSGTGINQGLTQGAVTETVVEPTIQETIVMPTIVQEVIRTDHIIEVQPVITRHIEQPLVHHVEKHIYQAAPPPAATSFVNAPIIHEDIQPHVINEVQEVLHKEIATVEVQHTQELREEHIALPPQHTYEVIRDPVLISGQNLQSGLVGQPGLAGSGSGIGLGLGLGAQPGLGLNQGLAGQQGVRGAEIPRASREARALEDLSALEDRRGRGVQAGAGPVIDNATGEPVVPRSHRSAAKLEEKAARVEAKHDAKRGNATFIA